jgi:D-amino peptidase
MKVFIQFDFEGVAGFVIRDNQDRNIPTVLERVRRLMKVATAEVSAAARGAFAAGASEVVIWDSHGHGDTLLVEELPENAELVTGEYSRPEWLPFFEGTDVGIYIGGHAMTGTPCAVTPHSLLNVNGVNYGEVGMFILECGSAGVPVVLVSGDSAVKREVASLIPDSEFVVTKEALGPTCAKTITPARSCRLIEDAARRGVGRHREIRPCVVAPPFKFRIKPGQPIAAGQPEFFEVNEGRLVDAYRLYLKTHHGYAKGWPEYNLRPA